MGRSGTPFHTWKVERVMVFFYWGGIVDKKKAPTAPFLVLTALLFYLAAISSSFLVL